MEYSREDPLWVIEAIAELINPAGRAAIIGPTETGLGPVELRGSRFAHCRLQMGSDVNAKIFATLHISIANKW